MRKIEGREKERKERREGEKKDTRYSVFKEKSTKFVLIAGN
jgi:hypothetical protein